MDTRRRQGREDAAPLPPIDPGTDFPRMTMISVSLFVSRRESRRHGFIGSVLRTCEQHLAGRYRMTVVNVDDDPQLAASSGLLATPALELQCGHERHRIVGDLAHESRLSESLKQFSTRAE